MFRRCLLHAAIVLGLASATAFGQAVPAFNASGLVKLGDVVRYGSYEVIKIGDGIYQLKDSGDPRARGRRPDRRRHVSGPRHDQGPADRPRQQLHRRLRGGRDSAAQERRRGAARGRGRPPRQAAARGGHHARPSGSRRHDPAPSSTRRPSSGCRRAKTSRPRGSSTGISTRRSTPPSTTQTKTFDLGGGRVVKPLLVRGHSNGCTVYLLPSEMMLFTGDALGIGAGRSLRTAASLKVFAEDTQKLVDYMKANFTPYERYALKVYTGHSVENPIAGFFSPNHGRARHRLPGLALRAGSGLVRQRHSQGACGWFPTAAFATWRSQQAERPQGLALHVRHWRGGDADPGGLRSGRPEDAGVGVGFMIGRPWLCAGLAAGIALAAGGARASYRAEQVGKVVRLTDTGTDTVVSFAPSVGNMAFEMRVKGHNVLYFPFESIDEYRRGPGGIPFLAPWANRLDEHRLLRQRTALRLRHGARQRARADPDPRPALPGRGVGGRRDRGGRDLGLGREPPRVLPISPLDEAVPVRPHHRDDPPVEGRGSRGAHAPPQPERGAHARVDRLPPLLPADRLEAQRVDPLGRGPPPVGPRRQEDPHGGDGADRAALPGPGGGAPARLRPRPRLRGPRPGRVGPGRDDREGPVAAARRHPGPAVPRRRRLRPAPERDAGRHGGGSREQLRVLRAHGRHHERDERRPQGPLPGAAEHPPRRPVGGELLDPAARVLSPTDSLYRSVRDGSSAQTKLSASSVLPVPLYLATWGRRRGGEYGSPCRQSPSRPRSCPAPARFHPLIDDRQLVEGVAAGATGAVAHARYGEHAHGIARLGPTACSTAL